MNLRIHAAVGEALTRLRTSDVIGATKLLQRAPTSSAVHGANTQDSVQDRRRIETPSARGLEAVLDKLRRQRASFFRDRGPEASAVEEPDHTENFLSRIFRSAIGSLTYKLYVPAGCADRELALIMMLHGCTQNADDFARGTRMNALAEEFGLIVAYPLQPKTKNAQGCWNWFDERHQQRGAGEPALLAGLAQELATEFAIERSRIFAAGLSAGGAMVDVLSSTYPEVFSAVGIHSGLPNGAASNVMSAFAAMKGNGNATAKPASTVRKIIFHGGSDGTVHPSNGKQVFDLARSTHSEPAEYQIDAVINGKRVTRSLIGQAQDHAIAEHWLIHGGGHAWSGGDHRGSYVDATGPDASREMVRFFLQG